MATDIDSAFGGLLRRHRAAAALSQEALAERAGLSARAVADLERGVRRFPYPETVKRLSDSLNLAAPERAAFIKAAERPRHVPQTPLDSSRRRCRSHPPVSSGANTTSAKSAACWPNRACSR